ncbi:MAG: hypothetical protein EOP04_14715 [Proteobacteria bacterium]|nr:MAG: hypothetical protein EOP04_14715 [Pseudomonadota bacterium]
MFLPLEAREVLLSINKHQPLIAHSEKLLEFPRPQKFLIDGYVILQIFFYTLLFLAGIAWYLVRIRVRNSIRYTAVFYRALGFATLPMFIYGGALGILMPLNWMFSGHVDLHHNANMFLFMPFDFIFCIVGFTWLFKGHPTAKYIGFKFKWLIALHMLCAISVVLSWYFGFIEQNIYRPIVSVYPIYLLSLVLIQLLDQDHTQKALKELA